VNASRKTAIRAACIAWAARAIPAQRAEYLRSGSRGPGMPVDLSPANTRALTMRAALKAR
jgi:hypothetical protein